MSAKNPWKPNFRVLPRAIQTAIAGIDSEILTVAATKVIAKADIANGLYSHVGLTLSEDEVASGLPVLPPARNGKWSQRNIYGWDFKREDWPKVMKTWAIESPNFGDGARNGWTMRTWSREVFQHQVFEPQGMMIESTVLNGHGGDDILVKFTLSPDLSKKMPEFDLMLLWSVNVLQENTGVANVFSSDATLADYIGTISLDWRVFPPGSVDEVVARLMGANQNTDVVDYERHVRERIQMFETFQPVAYLQGQGGFGSYFGAQFSDDFVVFENLRYGNAVYLLYDNWIETSQRSRLDLLRDRDAHFDRVPHNPGWETKLQALLHDRLFERGLRPRRNRYRYRRSQPNSGV